MAFRVAYTSATRDKSVAAGGDVGESNIWMGSWTTRWLLSSPPSRQLRAAAGRGPNAAFPIVPATRAGCCAPRRCAAGESLAVVVLGQASGGSRTATWPSTVAAGGEVTDAAVTLAGDERRRAADAPRERRRYSRNRCGRWR